MSEMPTQEEINQAKQQVLDISKRMSVDDNLMGSIKMDFRDYKGVILSFKPLKKRQATAMRQSLAKLDNMRKDNQIFTMAEMDEHQSILDDSVLHSLYDVSISGRKIDPEAFVGDLDEDEADKMLIVLQAYTTAYKKKSMRT